MKMQIINVDLNERKVLLEMSVLFSYTWDKIFY
jgi:hypothetical protein